MMGRDIGYERRVLSNTYHDGSTWADGRAEQTQQHRSNLERKDYALYCVRAQHHDTDMARHLVLQS